VDLGPAGNLLVGADTSDDAAVYRLAPDLAIVLTADLITPLVADPALFGRVAAQNSLSDIYAMGGVPLLAINLCCFPGEAPDAVLAEILEGGAREVLAAGAVVAGGHTVKDPELKYGLCVVGRVEPDAIWRNSAARVGDRLLLTKPIGSGMLYTGIQKGQAADAVLERAADEVLASSNRLARDALRPLRVSAATDVTGFGLLGHLAELAVGSGVRVVLNAQVCRSCRRPAASPPQVCAWERQRETRRRSATAWGTRARSPRRGRRCSGIRRPREGCSSVCTPRTRRARWPRSRPLGPRRPRW